MPKTNLNRNKRFATQIVRHKSSLAISSLTMTNVLLMALAADSEPSPSIQSNGDSPQSSEQFAPKRQYFIAPRIGRSTSSGTPRAIWSSLEEAGLIAPGQIQPNRGFPGPLRSSLLFLIGNQRLIRPRSASGLLPQARIGRRASPSGLLPQPRVGRRSVGPSSVLAGLTFEPGSGSSSGGGGGSSSSDYEPDELDGASPIGAAGQQEFAVAAMSDNAAMNEAVETLLNVSSASTDARNGPEGAIERPSNRAATAFVPRLGKRPDSSLSEGQRMTNLGRLLCSANTQDCQNQLAIIGAFARGLEVQEQKQQLQQQRQLDIRSNELDGGPLLANIDLEDMKFLRALQRQDQQLLMRRALRSSSLDGTSELLALPSDASGSASSTVDFEGASKRVAFTPRIGR